jgi:hypothetical protein
MPNDNRLLPADWAQKADTDQPTQPPRRILPHGRHTVPHAISGIRAILENQEALAQHFDAKIAELAKVMR